MPNEHWYGSVLKPNTEFKYIGMLQHYANGHTMASVADKYGFNKDYIDIVFKRLRIKYKAVNTAHLVMILSRLKLLI